MANPKTCAYCMYGQAPAFVDEDGKSTSEYRLCRRHAPGLRHGHQNADGWVTYNLYGEWPYVNEEAYCGEWERDGDHVRHLRDVVGDEVWDRVSALAKKGSA